MIREGQGFSDLVAVSRPENILEIGSWHGASIVRFLSESEVLGLTTKAVCIDTWLGNLEHWMSWCDGGWAFDQLLVEAGEPQFLKSFKENLEAFGFGEQVSIIRAPSEIGLKFLRTSNASAKFDLIYVDGDHSTNAVLSDLRLSFPLLAQSRTSLLSGDDWSWKSVRRALAIFCARRQLRVYVKDGSWVVPTHEMNSGRQLIEMGWKKANPVTLGIALIPNIDVIGPVIRVTRKLISRTGFRPN